MRLLNNQYCFSVEGETETWYLNWLKNEINKHPNITGTVSFHAKVNKDPFSYSKTLSLNSRTEIWHIFDFESEEKCHTDQFKDTLKRMKQAHANRREIIYKNGYSNLTFELWILLHKMDFSRSMNHRKDYCSYINRCFGESFENLKAYKHEKNFKRILSKLSLEDVFKAIERAKRLSKENHKSDKKFVELYGYTFCQDNPHTELWIIFESILNNAGLTKDNVAIIDSVKL